MGYYRFEHMEQIVPNPGLSSGTGAVIKGRYLTLRNNNKRAGTGSELHYHPNELIVFSLVGRLNCIVGKDRRILPPGVTVHMPSRARHSIRATEDGAVSYLYVKDNTWGLTGFAADEAMSDEARASDVDGDDGCRIEGLGDCYYPIIDDLDAPPISAERQVRVTGERIVFTFTDAPAGRLWPTATAEHERFAYVVSGGLETTLAGETRHLGRGDILHVSRGERVACEAGATGARFVAVEPTAWLEARIDGEASS